MSEVSFGLGILSQGDIVNNPEHHRILAKKSWLQMWDYLMMNDEVILARSLPVPWSLDQDMDIRLRRGEVERVLARFQSKEAYLTYINGSESYVTKDLIESRWPNSISRERVKWVVEQATVDNPLTLLDIGVGFGELSLNIAKKGYQVTGITPHKESVQWLNEIAQADKMPAQFIEGLAEDIDFGERKFDVVLCCELLEHVLDPRGVLLKCCDLANKSVIITTPRGSCEGGFHPNADWRRHNDHVRAFSDLSFRNLLGLTKEFAPIADIKIVESVTGLRGHPIGCYCSKLVRVPKEVKDVDTVVPSPGRGNGDANPEQGSESRRVQPQAVS